MDSAAIQADAVTGGKVATGTLDATDLADDSVATSELAVNAVGTAAIQADAVTGGKVATNTLDATDLAADAVASSELADASVDTAAIQADAVTSAKIPGGGIAQSDIHRAGWRPQSRSTRRAWERGPARSTTPPSRRSPPGTSSILNVPAALEAGLVAEAVNQDTAGQLRVRFCNFTALGSIDGAARTYNFLVIR